MVCISAGAIGSPLAAASSSSNTPLLKFPHAAEDEFAAGRKDPIPQEVRNPPRRYGTRNMGGARIAASIGACPTSLALGVLAHQIHHADDLRLHLVERPPRPARFSKEPGSQRGETAHLRQEDGSWKVAASVTLNATRRCPPAGSLSPES